MVRIINVAANPHRQLTFPATFLAISFAILPSNAHANPAQSGASDAKDSPAVANSAARPTSAPAPTVDECLAAHRESQALRKQYQLLESRALLSECTHAACPTPVKRDCSRWVEEIDQQLPSVVFRLDTSEGDSSRDIKVFVDGELRFQSLPNRATEFNPGTYRFSFSMPGKDTVEQEVVLGEAEKFKNIAVKFPSAQKPSEAVASTKPNEAITPGPTSKVSSIPANRPVPVASYVFAGLGVAAAASFAAWGFSSKSLRSNLENQCAPDCGQTEIDKIRTRALIADISLAASAASFGTAAILYFARPSVSTPVEVDVGVLPRGGMLGTLRIKAF
jgi:hypothetical protein